MNILVTGGTGFIGQHLAKAISKKNSTLILSRSKFSADDFLGKVVYLDLAEPLQNFIPSEKIDCVIHLAQSREYRNFPTGAVDMASINIQGTLNLLEWSRQNGVKKFIFTSTANVYQSSNSKFTEAHPTQPSSFYGASKLSAELLALQYQNYFQVEILRLFTVYGPNQKNMLFPNIIRKILANETIKLAQNIGLKISPIYIDDVISTISNLSHSTYNENARIMNLCGTRSVTLHQIVRYMEQICKRSAVIEITDEEPLSFVGCNKKLISSLMQTNFVNIKEGLLRSFKDDERSFDDN